MQAAARVVVDGGALVGRVDERGVRFFGGTPYGRAERFAAPQPFGGWTGERDATQFGPAAWQPVMEPPLVPGLTPRGAMSEDCLTLSVWAPEGAEGLPVLVWIHGGSYLTGAPSQPVYDGARLAARGAVVVSLTYRLGPFGFVSFEALGGGDRGWIPNAGLHDVGLALEWVRDNVAAFGGDRSRVTVFGESAGAGVILHLLGAPDRASWFDRAIVQSGAPDRTFDDATAAMVAEVLCRASGGTLDALASVTPEQLVDAAGAVFADPAVARSVGMMAFHPCVDGALVHGAPVATVAGGAAAGCDLVVGVTRGEMALYLDAPAIEPERLVRRVARFAGVDDAAAAEVVAGYEAQLLREGGRAAPIDVWAAVYTDIAMTFAARQVLDGAAAHHAATFGYVFTWPAPARPGGIPLGAAHAVDVPFTFGTFDADGWDAFVGATGERAPDAHALSARIQDAWILHAATGAPGWPAWSSSARPMRELGVDDRLLDDPIGRRTALWPGAAARASA